MQDNFSITADHLSELLSAKDSGLIVIDVRPAEQRNEWYIPGSIHIDAYKDLNEGNMSVLDQVQVSDHTKVVTVCAAGRISQIAADELRKRGVESYSLVGGMKAWSLAWNIAELSLKDIQLSVIQIRRTGKGCLSYLIASGTSAIIVDPSVDIEVYEHLLTENKLQLHAVFETHTHADHLSRACILADKFEAKLMLPAASKVVFPYSMIHDGDTLNLNTISLRAIATPGHTFDSTSYLLNGKVLFTGDTLFSDSIGRPDLKSTEEEAKVKSTALFHSLKRLLTLSNDIIVLPGHTSKPPEFDGLVIQTTIGKAKKDIEIIRLEEDQFVNEILKRIPPTPENYLEIVESNLAWSSILNTELEAGANRCAIN